MARRSLLPEVVPTDRHRAKFFVKIYKADGLPKMNYSILANVKQAFTGEALDLVDPYVQVFFAGMTGSTSVKKNCYAPVWNEQIVFREMFPTLCQRIKIQLRNSDTVHPNIIGTHFIDLQSISNDGEKGFLPTFGPAYIYLYGSTRDYSLLDQNIILNMGMGEGVSYRARILISILTEITDNIEYPPASDVKVEMIPPINESTFFKNNEFFLFASVFDANMIDKSLTNKHIQFELSIGNSGNSLDGHNDSVRHPQDLEFEQLDEMSADTGYWQSTTAPTKASAASDKNYYYLPYCDHKQCMHVRSIWPDHRRRMYNSNMISNIIDKFEEGLIDTQAAIAGNDKRDVTALKTALGTASAACAQYVRHMTNGAPIGNTKLDSERQRMCLLEIKQMSIMTKSLMALITNHTTKYSLCTAYTYLDRLKLLCEDPQQAMPDIFIWMISNGKRLAYKRIPAKDIIYSDYENECGKHCGKMQTFFMKWPGNKAPSRGWNIPAKISVYFWLGVVHDKKHYINGLPQGYELSSEIKDADKLRSNAPSVIFYTEKHTFQMRAYVYQARSLKGSDSSGLSDPFAKVIIGESTATTQVIDQTLSPAWDELLLFKAILLYGTLEQIKFNPPTIVIEIFNQDKVGKFQFIGRTLAKPHVKAFVDPYQRPQFPPSLEWHEISRGDDKAGELLATFELLEVPANLDSSVVPELPTPKDANGKAQLDPNECPILPVPRGIRPTLSKYRIEILLWGLRDLKRLYLKTVDKPRVDIECAGNFLYFPVIENATINPNFTNSVKFLDVELPDQDLYRPPLMIRVVDCRSFGIITLVGTHIINSIHRYIYTPMTITKKGIEEQEKSTFHFQNVDLLANGIAQEEVFSIENEQENCPLLAPTLHFTTNKRATKTKSKKQRQVISHIDEKDWWTKYVASVASMTEKEKEAMKTQQGYLPSPQSPQTARERTELHHILGNKLNPANWAKNFIHTSDLLKIYPHELEAVPEFDEFKEWVDLFELYRGNITGDDTKDESRVVGVLKCAIKVYKWPLSKEIENHTVMGFDPNYGFFQYAPSNDPVQVLVRVYIVKATNLCPMDLNGKADPYIVLYLGSKSISDKENYVSKQLNPVFGKCLEIEATFPQDFMLTIQVLDWDLLGSDDLIGETKIDLENRFYSRHRATCGLPMKYEEQGYNRWRDAMKPSQILAKLCKDGKLEPPVYEYGRVKVGRTVFNMPMQDAELFSDPDTVEEQMALLVLRRWHEVPRVGARLVFEHVETRPLYNPNKPGIEQGRLEMWVDLFPMDMPLPGPPMDISVPKPKSYEMRVIIWNTDDVVLDDDDFFTGEKMSDIYVKGWVKGPEDCQVTDIHYRSLTGEGNFNWRFIYSFEYLEAERCIVLCRKESVFALDETEYKIPARLRLQVWDADQILPDNYLGDLVLDLNRFPRGAKTSRQCTPKMLIRDGTVPTVNIFEQKRAKGWWPFYVERVRGEKELTGKVELEINLLTREEADNIPAGLGRKEPDPLEKPNRPESSYIWILNPLKSLKYIVWRNHKWGILKTIVIILVVLVFALTIYSVPGYSVKKIMRA